MQTTVPKKYQPGSSQKQIYYTIHDLKVMAILPTQNVIKPILADKLMIRFVNILK
jgi:hypothetical protein